YTASGQLDPTFGSAGQATVGSFEVTRAVLLADGRIAALGEFGRQAELVRLTAAGQFDPEFGHDGLAGAIVPGRDLTATPEGRLVTPLDGFNLRFTVPDAPEILSFAAAMYGDAALPLGGTPHERLVARLYGDLLHRPPDPGGFAFWAGLLDRGASAFDVARAFQAGAEYRAVVVRDAYQQLLRRQADAGGLATFTQFLARGGTPDQVRATLLGSAEYFATFANNNNQDFLDLVYHDTLNRSADQAGRDHWEQALRQGVSREAVALAMLGSREADSVLVQDLYERLLGRDADDSGL